MSHVSNRTVFISYRRDVAKFIARAVFQDLRSHGWDVFMDVESIDSGEFDRIILNQIVARAHFVVILTPGTLERCAEPNDWLRREIEYAFEKDRNIVPLLTNGFDFARESAYLTGRLAELKRRNGLNVPYDYFDEAMERLRTRYLKQPVYGTVTPIPADERAEVDRRVNKAAAQPQVTAEQLTAEEYFIRGYKKHTQHNDLDGAIGDYAQAIQVDPRFIDAYHSRGIARYHKGDLDGAIADFCQVILINPKYVDAYNNRGWAFALRGDLDDAIADYDTAIHLDPKYVSAYYNRGIALKAKGDVHGAIRDYSRVIRFAPSNTDAYLKRGYLRHLTGDVDGAIEDYTNALRLDPNLAVAYNGRGWALALKGQLESALKDCNNALRLDPNNANAYDSRGYVLMQLGNIERAEEDFEKAIMLNESLAASYFQRGRLRQMRGDLKGAVTDFERYIALGGESDFNNIAEVQQKIRELKLKLGRS